MAVKQLVWELSIKTTTIINQNNTMDKFNKNLILNWIKIILTLSILFIETILLVSQP